MELFVSVKDSDPNAPKWLIDDDLDGELTYDDLAYYSTRMLYGTSREVLREELGKGFDPNYRTRTDNKWEKDPNMVRPFGKIEYFSRINIGPSVLDAYSELLRRSPIRTRQYYASHYVFVNSRVVATSFSEVQRWSKFGADKLKSGDFIRIVNVVPYASRIEVRGERRGIKGKSKGQNIAVASKSSVMNGTYHQTARSVRSKYKAGGQIRSGMMPNGWQGIKVKASGRFRTSYIEDKYRNPNRRKRYSGPYVYPYISFAFTDAGIKTNTTPGVLQ